jgi:hypothetical protein
MNSTPPEANTEYSRGPRASGGVSEPSSPSDPAGRPAASAGAGALVAALFAVALLGSAALLVAEFTTLFTVHVSNVSRTLQSTSTGSHHSYAMAVIAVCAAVLAVAAWRGGSRPAMLGIGLLGLAALLIALLGDLPDATASGLLLTSSHYVEAKSTPSAGFFIEIAGALLLMIASVAGFLLTEPAPKPRRPAAGQARERA